MFKLGLEGLVRFEYRNVMEGKYPIEGMDTLTILFENNWDFLFVTRVKSLLKPNEGVVAGAVGWSQVMTGLGFLWAMCIELCTGQWSKQSHVFGRLISDIIWDKINVESLKAERRVRILHQDTRNRNREEGASDENDWTIHYIWEWCLGQKL